MTNSTSHVAPAGTIPMAIPLETGPRLEGLADLDIDIIVPDPENPWGCDDGEDAQGLANSIRTLGVLQPPRVRWHAALGKWMITAGERRWRQAKAAGHTTIACVIDAQATDPVRIHKERIAENLHRRVGKPIRLARALQTLQQQGGLTLAQLAEAIGKKDNLTWVSRKLSLLKLSPPVQDAIDAGVLDESVAVELAKIKHDDQREALAQRALREQLTRDQVAELAAALGRKKRVAPPAAKVLRRVLCQLPGDSTVAVTCPANVAELTTEVLRDTLEFALQEIRKAQKKGVTVRELASYFQQLKPKNGTAPALIVTPTATGHGQPMPGSLATAATSAGGRP